MNVRAYVRLASLSVLVLTACSVKPISTRPPTVERDAGGDGPKGGGFVRPTVGACVDPPGSLQPLGASCTCHGACMSGQCVDGVCCNTSCLGTCQACNVPGLQGTCSPVPAGLPPVIPGQCPAQPVGGCGQDGTCDGKGACRSYPDGTMCAPGICQNEAVMDARVCSGGACKTMVGVTCAPFGCDETTNTCYGRCTTDDQCAPGIPCHNGLCGTKPPGAMCDEAAECQSNQCTDGVCCNLPCTGACVSCKEVGRVGTCTPVPVGHPDPHDVCLEQSAETCGQTGACNGMGACARYPAGTVCKPAACSGASLTAASVCDAAGTCAAGAPLSCAPYVCAAGACMGSCTGDDQCLAPAACVAGSCGPKGLGQPCTDKSQCGSGFCVDGVCCESTCEGKCLFCALPGSPGRCRNVPADMLDPRAAGGVTDATKVCLDAGMAACAGNGRCDGAGGCQSYPDGTVCQPETCDPVANRESGGVCTGGTCVATSGNCDPHVCNGIRCGQGCSTSAECARPNVCQNGSCGRKPNGQPCTGTNPQECQSGICAQGVCCATPCSGSCLTCALATAPGICMAVPDGGADPAKVCVDGKPAACGTDGKCDGNGGCRRYAPGTLCSPPICSSGMAKLASFCTNNTCPPPGSETCTPIIVCNAGGTACERTCTKDTQCLPGTKCFGGKCGLLDNGKACGDGTDCKSKFCTDGVCCDMACGGTNTNDCQACSRAAGAATDGVCAPRNGLTCNDGSKCTRTDTCVGTVCTGGNPVVCMASDQCHLAGTCDPATGTCSNPAKGNGEPCSDNNMCTVGDSCQAGLCKPGGPKPCPPGDQCVDVCDPRTGTCNPPKQNGTKCNDNNMCTTGQDVCTAGRCTGTANKVCPAPKACQAPGVCQPTTGMCSYAMLDNGTACADPSKCIDAGQCAAGVCTGEDKCERPTSCRRCNATTGACTGANKPNTTPCEDGNKCTKMDTCNSGTCRPGAIPPCAVPGCQICDPNLGECVPRNEGLDCSDGDRCTQLERCVLGRCVPSAMTMCPRPDCQRCDPATGACNPPVNMCPTDAGAPPL